MLRTKAFTLFETLIALIILSIILSGISRLITTNTDYTTYQSLQLIENNFYLTNND